MKWVRPSWNRRTKKKTLVAKNEWTLFALTFKDPGQSKSAVSWLILRSKFYILIFLNKISSKGLLILFYTRPWAPRALLPVHRSIFGEAFSRGWSISEGAFFRGQRVLYWFEENWTSKIAS
jgi:hypothetical protein